MTDSGPQPSAPRKAFIRRFSENVLASIVAVWVLAYIITPLFSWFSSFVISLINGFFKNISDDIYTQIATGTHSAYWHELFGLAFPFMLMVLGVITTFAIWNNTRFVKHLAAQLLELIGAPKEHLPVLKQNCVNSAERLEFFEKKSRAYKYQEMIITTIVFTLFLLYYGIKAGYIDRAIVNFEQRITILSPYMTQEEQSKIKSQFAQVHDQSGYQVVMDILNGKAKDNNLVLPK